MERIIITESSPGVLDYELPDDGITGTFAGTREELTEHLNKWLKRKRRADSIYATHDSDGKIKRRQGDYARKEARGEDMKINRDFSCDKCTHEVRGVPNKCELTTGLGSMRSCHDERSNPSAFACGPAGKNWEPKTQFNGDEDE